MYIHSFDSVYKPLVQVDIGLLANQVGVSATNTLDLGQGVHDLLLSIDVGVEETQDELDCLLLAIIIAFDFGAHTVRLLSTDERHDGQVSSVTVLTVLR